MDPGTGMGEDSAQEGLFLVLEGVEGVGKTTQARLLLEWMEGLGLPARLGREPGGTVAGEAIREILLVRDGLEIQAETELLLMLAARAAFVREVVRPLLEAGGIMLADRFETSTFAYQGFGRGLPLVEIQRLNRFATGGLRPDLVLVLDLPWEEGRARQQREGKAADRIESAGDAFLERVRVGYRRLAEDGSDVVLVDGSASPERVQEEIRSILRARFPETFDLARCSEEDTPDSPSDDDSEDLP